MLEYIKCLEMHKSNAENWELKEEDRNKSSWCLINIQDEIYW